MNKYISLFRQLIFFGFVGLVSLAIDVSVTTLTYKYLGFPAYLSSGIGFLSAFFFNFPMNRKKVFKHTQYDRFSLKIQIILYICLSLFNLFATSLLVQAIVLSGIADISIAKIIVTAIIAMWNFIIFKTFIFSKKRSKEI